MDEFKNGALRIWHIPQIPGPTYNVNVDTVKEALKIIVVLWNYDDFQFINNIKPDYSNVTGLEVFENGEWTEWADHDGNDINNCINNINIVYNKTDQKL